MVEVGWIGQSVETCFAKDVVDGVLNVALRVLLQLLQNVRTERRPGRRSSIKGGVWRSSSI